MNPSGGVKEVCRPRAVCALAQNHQGGLEGYAKMTAPGAIGAESGCGI